MQYVGVLFYSFNKIQTEQLGLHSLDLSQKEWLSIVPYLCSLTYVRIPPYPTETWKQKMYDIAMSSRLEQVVLVAVFLNVVELCVWWHAMPDSILLIKERLNLAFSLCFLVRAGTALSIALSCSLKVQCHQQKIALGNIHQVQAEMFIKVAGIGWREYWINGWNKLDFSLVCLSIVDLAFSYLQSSFLRIIKVLKAQKLLKVCFLRIIIDSVHLCIHVCAHMIACVLDRSAAPCRFVGFYLIRVEHASSCASQEWSKH